MHKINTVLVTLTAIMAIITFTYTHGKYVKKNIYKVANEYVKVYLKKDEYVFK